MSLLNKKKPSEHYSQGLRPSVFGNTKPDARRSAPWFGKVVSWASDMLPSQSKRTLWLSKPTTWGKSIMSWAKHLAPRQLNRTQWLSRMLSPFSRRSPFHSGTTFGDIRKALDNSQFRHLSHPELSPGQKDW